MKALLNEMLLNVPNETLTTFINDFSTTIIKNFIKKSQKNDEIFVV